MEPSSPIVAPTEILPREPGGAAADSAPAESEGNLYRLCVESSPYGILIHDSQGNIKLFNRRLEEITGYRSQEMPNIATWIEALCPDPDYRDLVIRLRGEPLADGEVRIRDAMITRRSGERRLCRFASTFFPNNHRVVYVRDIHDSLEPKALPPRATDHFDYDCSPQPIPVLAWHLLGQDFILVGYNQAAENLLGPPLVAGLATKASEFCAHQPDIVEDLHRCLAARATIRRRCTFLPGDPSRSPIFEAHFSYRPPSMVILRLLNPGGLNPTSAAVQENERLRIEEALRNSDRKFSLAFHASPAGFAITSFEDGRHIDVNAADCRMTGYRREEIIGKSIFELNIWADPQDSLRLRKLLAEQGVVENFEFRFRRKDGEIRTGLLMAALIDIAGERCIISEYIDLTDLKRAEETLKLSEGRLRMATEGAQLALWDWDLTTGRVFCNDLYYRLLGYEPGEFEVNYETWRELVHPDDREEAEALTRAALLKGSEDYSSEYRIRRKDGTYRWVHDMGRAVQRDAEGRPTRALGIHVDTTRRKEIEAALRRTHDELEQHVQMRTRELVKSNRSLKQQIERRLRVEKELRAKEKQLGRQTQDLLEVNAALKVLLRQREEDRREIEEQISAQLKNLVLPYLEKLKRGNRSPREKNYLGIVEAHLRGLAAPATAGITDKLYRLTPAEIQVANFIKSDKGSKEIAALLGVTVKTVEFHRYSIRRKMGLLNRRVNLRSFLKTLK